MPVKAQKVMVIQTGVVYDSVRECAKAIGGDYGSIYACLNGNRKTHKEYTFKYVEGDK